MGLTHGPYGCTVTVLFSLTFISPGKCPKIKNLFQGMELGAYADLERTCKGDKDKTLEICTEDFFSLCLTFFFITRNNIFLYMASFDTWREATLKKVTWLLQLK